MEMRSAIQENRKMKGIVNGRKNLRSKWSIFNTKCTDLGNGKRFGLQNQISQITSTKEGIWVEINFTSQSKTTDENKKTLSWYLFQRIMSNECQLREGTEVRKSES
jgi:hypothetical protein